MHNYHDVHQINVPGGDGSSSTHMTWYHRVLPYIEQQSLYDAIVALSPTLKNRVYDHPTLGASEERPNAMARISVMWCPSMEYGRPIPGNAATDNQYLRQPGCYVISMGPTNYGHMDYWEGGSGVIVPAEWAWCVAVGQPFSIGWYHIGRDAYFSENGLERSFAIVTDGLSNTVFLSEVTPVPGLLYSYGDPQLIRGCGFTSVFTPNNDVDNDYIEDPYPKGTVGRTKQAACDGPSTWYQNHMKARSMHSGGVNAGLGDGSIRFIADTIAAEVWARANTGGDGTPINLP